LHPISSKFAVNADYTTVGRDGASLQPFQLIVYSVLQGSVLGSLSFSAYTEDVVDLLDRHKVQLHLYTDDTQLYASCRPDDVDILRTRLSHCSADVAQWCASRRLQLNANKTEVIWFGSHVNIKKLCDHQLSVRVGPKKIIPVRAVRDLGAQLDKEISLKAHVATKLSSACYYHLRRLRQIRRRVGAELTTQLVLALVMWRLDYCDAVLTGMRQSTLEPLQRVQNAAARLVHQLDVCVHVTPNLMVLHWLPIRCHIDFKLCTMYVIHTGRCSAYLENIVCTFSSAATSTGLRLASSNKYVTPWLRTKFEERSFLHAGQC